MKELWRLSKTARARALRHATTLFTFLTIASAVWCQTNELAKEEKDSTKAAAKVRKEALKEADKAIRKGKIEQLKAILQAHPEIVSSPVPQGMLAGMIVAPMVSLAVPGANGPGLVNAAQQGVTLIYDAAWYNRKEAVELLLAFHADVNVPDGLGFTPLHEAISARSPEIVHLLLENGANVNARARNGDTPLMLLRWEAASTGHRQPYRHPYSDIEELLLQHGAQ